MYIVRAYIIGNHYPIARYRALTCRMIIVQIYYYTVITYKNTNMSLFFQLTIQLLIVYRQAFILIFTVFILFVFIAIGVLIN